MPDPGPAEDSRFPVRALETSKGAAFDLRPDAGARRALADDLGLLALKKLRFAGEIRPQGKADWVLTARLGATVVQPCVVTLEPVTTRLEEKITRRYLAEPPPVPEAEESEIPDDDTIEDLPSVIDVARVMEEALALALPDWPRAPGAELVETSARPPGADPIGDADVKPFAALKALRDRMDDPD